MGQTIENRKVIKPRADPLKLSLKLIDLWLKSSVKKRKHPNYQYHE